MPRTAQEPKEITLNLRLDKTLKSEFMKATMADSRPRAEILRSLLRDYVRQARQKAFLAEAERQSRLIANTLATRSDETEAVQWVEDVSAPLPQEPDDSWFRLPNDWQEGQ